MIVEKYVDPLPVPEILEPKSKKNGTTHYEVEMKQFSQKLHRDIPATTLWGYEGVYPGPTFEVNRYEKVRVKWINHLPLSPHLLPVDTTVHGAGPDVPPVRTVVHLHGGHVPPESDGFPEAWFTTDFAQVGKDFTTETYEYPNQQPPSTLWYHDHSLGITRLNVYAGLAGFYIIRDAYENSLKLPSGAYEIPLVIQDRSFNDDGSLFYPTQPAGAPAGIPNPSVVPEFFGDTILVNGKVWPYLNVEPRKYRFRVLNGSNSRFYNMSLLSQQGAAAPYWCQIGTDGGFLTKPVQLSDLLLSPAERADVIIDFSQLAGQVILLTNNASAPFPSGDPVDPETTGQIMQFRVSLPLSGQDTSKIPSRFSSVTPIPKTLANKTRSLTLMEHNDQYGRLMMMLDGKMWEDPVTETPKSNSTEIWQLINLTMDTHPIHLHLVEFQILDRQPFDMELFMSTGEIRYTGPAFPPAPNEAGWKDTVRANPGEITRIIMRFTDYTGLYVWHCHILEHEDYDMMRPYRVIP